MKSKKDRLKDRIKIYDCPENIHDRMNNRKKRLQTLCDRHGVELVALACGYTESTLNQYLRSSLPTIGKESLDRAELLLKNL